MTKPNKLTATVYGRKDCPACVATVKVLKVIGVPTTEHQIDDHPDKIAYMQQRGWSSLPLVEIDESGVPYTWHGYSDEDLRAVKAVWG